MTFVVKTIPSLKFILCFLSLIYTKYSFAQSGPNLSLGGDQIICASSSITVNATISNSSVSVSNYAWTINGISISGNNSSITVNASLSPDNPQNVTCTATFSNNATLTESIQVFTIDPGTIGGNQFSCTSPFSPTPFTSINAGTNSFAYTNNVLAQYQWQSSVNGTNNWNDIPGATSSTYQAPSTASTNYYRRKLSISIGNGNNAVSTDCYSNVVVLSILNAGLIGTDQVICNNSSPATLTNVNAASIASPASIQYQWQSSIDNSIWNNIVGATGLTYSPSALTQDLFFRRVATISVNNVSACSESSNVVYIDVLTSITLDAGANINTCVGQNVTLNPTLSGAAGYTVQYQWSGPNNFSSSNETPTINNIGLNANGTYTLSATIGGCTLTDNLTINALGVSITSGFFNGNNTQLVNCLDPQDVNGVIGLNLVLPTNLSSIQSVSINWGDGPAVIIPSANYGNIQLHTYSPGAYDITITLTSTSGCTSSVVYPAFIGSSPSPAALQIFINQANGCVPHSTDYTFSVPPTNVAGTTYTVTWGDGTPNEVYTHPNVPTTLSHTYNISSCGSNVAISGTTYYNVFQPSVITQNPCSVQPQPSAAGLISVGLGPDASFTVSRTTLCQGGNVQLNNTSNFGLTVPTSGGASCISTSPFYWTITNSSGNSTGYTVLTGSLGSNNGLTGTGPNVQNGWTSGSTNPNIQFSVPGIYTINLIVKNKCGLDIASQTICVVSPPVSSINTINTIQCSPATVSLSSNSTLPMCGTTVNPVAYQWTVTNPSGCTNCSSSITSSTLANASLSLVNNSNTIQTYTVSLTVTPLNPLTNLPLSTPSCAHTSTTTVQVYPNVTFTNNNTATLCSGGNLGINLTTNVASNFTWVATPNSNISGESTTTQTGSVINDQLVNLTNSPQTVTYTAIATSSVPLGSCTQSQTLTITVNPAISLNALPDLIVCPGVNQSAIAFTSIPSTGVTVNWTNNTPSIGLAASGVGNIPGFTPVNNSSSIITATITATPSIGSCNGISQTFTITINFVNPGSIGATQNLCTDEDPAILNVITPATGSGTTTTILWQQSASPLGPWTSINGQTGTSYDPPVLNSTTYYSVLATTSSNNLNCSAYSPPVAISIYSISPGTISNSQTICTGGDLPAFSNTVATSNASSINYQWQSSIDNINWTNITGANSAAYDPPALMTSTYFRRQANAIVGTIIICQGMTEVITVTVVPDPTVSTPSGETICTGGTPSTLSVAASGGISSNYNYQWYSNSTNSNSGGIAVGTNSPNLTPSPTSTTFYYCLVTIPTLTNTGCSVSSGTAQIIVVADPVVTAPTSASYCQDAAAVNALSVIASGGLNTSYSYQWYSNTANNNTSGTIISSATSATFTPPVNIVGIQYYYCVVSVEPSTTGCSTASAVAAITVTAGPSFANHPLNQTRCLGGTFTALSVVSQGGSGMPTYQWFSNTTNSNTGGTLISGATSSSYTPPTSLSSTVGITYYYCVISFSSTGGCSAISSNPAAVTVLATPTVNPLSNQVYCKNVVALATPLTANYSSGMSYAWSLSGSSVGLSPTSGATATIPGFTTVNNGTAPVTATVTVTPSYTIANVNNGASLTCPGSPTTAFTITVNPTPVMPAFSPQLFVFCEDETGFVPFTSNITSGITYSWTNDNTQIGVGATGTSTSPGLSFTAVNNLSNPNQPLTSNFYVTPIYTNSGVACPGTERFFAITINPLPDVNQLSDITICATNTGDNQYSSLNPIVGLGTSYVWTNSNPAIGLPASGTGDFYFTALNTSLVPINSTVTVTPTYTNNGVTCTGANDNFVITVNPMPTVNAISNQGLCVGSSTAAVTPTGNIPGTVYTWSNNNTSTGLAAGGTALIPDFIGLNTTNAPNISTISVVPSYTYNNITCTGTAGQFGITINPTPNVDPIADQQVCAQYNTTVQFTSTPNIVGTVYNWTNNNTAIGLSASGTGALSFNATNTTTSPITATVTVTPSFTSAGSTCWGTPETFDIVVLPTPVMNPLSNQTVCSGNPSAAISFSSNLTGTQYTWTNSNANIGLLVSGSGSSIGAFNSINNGSAPAQGLISVTPSLVTNNQTCSGTAVTTLITVNPIPVMANIYNPSFCFGAPASISLSSNINTGVVYNWTNSNTAIGLGASGAGNISFTTNNTNSTPISGLINVSPVYTNNNVQCTGNSASFTVQIAPNPLVNPISNQVFCSGIQSAIIPISGTVTGASYGWTNANTAIGLQASGTGNIPVFNTANSSTTSIASSLVTVSPTLLFNGQTCTGPSTTFSIQINPGTTINTVPNVQLCNGETSVAINFSGSGSNYTWTNNGTNIGIASSGTGGIPSFTAINTGITPVSATITVTSQFSGGGTGCNGGSTTFDIQVLPTPSVVDPPNLVVCSGTTVNEINLYGVATNYTWTNNAPSIGLTNTGTTATIPTFTASNSGTNPVLATVNISPSYVSGTKVCTGISQSYTINVIPIPIITSQPQSQTVCLGGTLTNLSVAYSGGNGTPSYQWFSNTTNSTTNGSIISGATSASFTLPAANTVGTTYYYCTLTFANAAACATISTNLAAITITSGPSISTQPLASQAICQGGSIPAPLSVAFSNGNGNPTIQWFSVNGGTNTPISGANTTSYMPGVFNTIGTYFYMAQISLSGSGCGLAQSNTVQVNVLADPTVTSPIPASYCLNSSTAVPLSITASGGTSTPYNYQWYSNSVNNNTNGTLISGANAASYIPFTSSVATTYYYCIVTQDNGCSVSSNAAAIAVTSSPFINSQPIGTQTVCLDGAVSPLTVAYGSGSGAPSYQWYSNSINSYIGGVAIPGAATSSYVPLTNLVGTTYYFCVITFTSSGCSSISSNISQIVVIADPTIITQPLNTQTICGGGSIPNVLNVSYSGGTGTLSYQWFSVNGSTNTMIGSATSSTYLPPAFTTPGTYNFAVQISLSGSGCNMVQSNNAQVIVLPDPTVTAPASATYCNGYSPIQALSVVANGGITNAYAYQWYSNTVNSNAAGTLITGATGANYTPPVTTNGTVYYYCLVSQGAANTGCSVASATALITTAPAPAITSQPTTMQTACVGGTLTNLTVAYTGALTSPSYQWFSNAVNANTGGTPIPGANAASYLPPNNTAATTYYYCVISFPSISCTTVSSNTGGVTIHPDPIISVQPIASQAVCFGTTLPVPLNISYTGGYGTPTYQWNVISGSTASAVASTTTYLPPSFNVSGSFYYNVILTLSGNGCNVQTSNQTEVIVIPVPVINSVESELYCNDDLSDLFHFTGPIAGTTFSWINDNQEIGLAGSGLGDIVPFTVTNLNNFGIVGNISVTPQLTTYNTVCSGAPFEFQIMVNPYQDVQDPQDLILCHGTGVNGVQFFGSALINNWTNDLPALGVPASGSGSLPAFLAVNNGTQPIVAHLSVTPSFNAVTTCPGDIETFTITILPNPNVSVIPTSQTICSGDLSGTINMSGIVTSFAWTNNHPSIGLAASGTGNIPSFLSTATGSNTTSTITVTPIYSLGGVSCPGPSQNAQINVVPTPAVLPLQDIVLCNGDATGLIQILGNASELNWSSSNPSIGTTTTGAGSISSFNVINPTQNPVSTVITVTPVNLFAGLTCMAPATDFSIIVNPTPTINPIADEVLCAQSNSPAILFSGNANGFIWTNSNSAIGLSTSGTGNISSFVTQNNLPSVATANVSVTPQFTNAGLTCQGTSEFFVIDVLPLPILNTINPQVVCNGDATSPIIFTGNATNYSWINNNASIGLASAGSGNISGFNTVAGATNNVANLVVTPSYTYNNTSCFGIPQSTTITALPVPTINNVVDIVNCNGITSGVLAFSGTASNYTWTNSNTSIGLVAGGTGDIPAFNFTNSSSNPITATITVTPQTSQGVQSCVGIPEIFTITVNPTPTMVLPSNQVLCSQAQSLPVIFTTLGNATSYSWINSNTTIGLPSFGNGNIGAFTAQNNGPLNSVALIQVTPKYTNAGATCLGTPQNFTITVEPIPSVQYSQIAQQICTGNSTNSIVLSSQTPGVSFSWNIQNPSGSITGLNALSGNGNIPAMTLVNSSSNLTQFNFEGVATTPLASCIGYGQLGTISVNPEPIINNINDTTICNGDVISQLIIANIPSTYIWSAQNNLNVNGESVGPNNSNYILNSLQNVSSTVQNVNYTITPTSITGGCVGVDLDFNVEVIPNIILDTLVTPLDTAICSGELTNIFLQSNYPSNMIWYALPNPNVSGETTTATAGSYISDILVNNTPFNQYVTYYIDLISSPNACSGVPQLITVLVYPSIQLTNTTNFDWCSNDPLVLNLAATVNASFTWYATNNGVVLGETTSPQNTSLINDILTNNSAVTEQVYYAIDVLADISGCTAYDLPLTINVLPLPILQNNDTTICSGEYTNINLVTNIPASIIWNGVFNIPIIGETYANISGTYINDLLINDTGQDDTLVYEISSTANGCTAPLDSVLVIVHDQPDVDFSVLTNPLCSKDTIQFTNLSSPNFDFDWSFGDGGTSVDYSPIHTYNNSGIFEVMLLGTNPINNCSATDSTTIVVNKMPDASFYTLDTVGCGNLNATFYANYQATSEMVWDFGDGQTLTQVGNVTNFYGQAGCYDVSLTVTSPEGCIAQDTYNDYVCIYENPLAFIGATPTSVNALNPTVQFTNSSQNSISYIWQMGDGAISYDDNPTYIYPMEGADYHVLMTAFNEVGCFDTASVDIHVFEELIFYVPNTFTPNEDEKNQTFYPVLSQGMKRNYMEFYIYNRWGELVFESHDPLYGWDGTYGQDALDCPNGTYTWKLKLESLQTQEILDFHGHVNLIR